MYRGGNNDTYAKHTAVPKHDDVIKWKFFSALLTICAGTSLAPVTSPHNNRETGDLRRHRAHYDVIVMDDMYCNSITVEIG